MTSEEFKFIEINEEDIENVFREINVNASPGEDKIPSKLAKLARKYIVKPLKEAINVAFYICVFPNNAKHPAVTPLDKGTKNRNSINNYRPVFNFFSKFYENVIKEQVTSFMDSKLSPFSYRKNYSTQHVLLRLVEEGRKN